MFLKVFILSLLGTLATCSPSYGSPIIYNQPYSNHHNAYPPNVPRGILMPPRAVTTLNTYVPKSLIPPAPPRSKVPRVYEKTPPPRIYTVPPVYRTIAPAPTTTRKPQYMHYTRTNGVPSRYAYNYSVNDIRTGDIKNAEERLENGVVRGSYSLVEPDGITVRRITYTADDVNGFVANVERTNRPLTPPLNANNQFTIITQ